MKTMKSYIYFCVKVPGYHCYPEAELLNIRERHFHEFGIEVKVSVTELNREIEFIALREEFLASLHQRFMSGEEFEFGTLSCEQIAVQVAKIIASHVGVREMIISVEETDEGAGAEIHFLPEDFKDLKANISDKEMMVM